MQQGFDGETVRHSDQGSALRHRDKHDQAAAGRGQLEQPDGTANAGDRASGSPKGGAWWNIRTSTGSILAKWFPERPSHTNRLLKEGQTMIGGGEHGYRSRDVAVTRERSDKWYPWLCKQAIERGYRDYWGKKVTPTYAELAEWTGLSIHSLRAWFKPVTAKSHRPMPRYAIRLILHEFSLHDHSRYDWQTQLDRCR